MVALDYFRRLGHDNHRRLAKLYANPELNWRPTGRVVPDCDPGAGRSVSITAVANVSAEVGCSSLASAPERVLHSG